MLQPATSLTVSIPKQPSTLSMRPTIFTPEVKQVCCSQAETCDSNSGRGKIGHHGKSGRSKSGRSKHGHRKSGHVKSGHRKSGHVKSGRGHSGRRGKSGRLGRSGRRGNGGGTSVTDLLNGLISSDPNGAVYKGGQGVMFRDQKLWPN